MMFRISTSALVLGLAFFLSTEGVRGQGNKAPELPFRTTSDGKVNFKDLLELAKQPTARDRISDDELEAIKQEHLIEYGKGFTPTEKPTMPPRNDLYASSIILSDGVNHTILPKQALIHVPELQADRVVDKAEGELVLWPDFLKRHRAWLRPQEVTLELAKGEKAMMPEQLQSFQLGSAIVVAVYRGSPISMLPVKEPEADAVLHLTSADPAGAPEAEAGESDEKGKPMEASKQAAAESLAQVEDEAKTVAEKNQAATTKTTAPTRQGSTFSDRTKSRFGRFSK